MCVFLRRHDALFFLHVRDGAMTTTFLFPGPFAPLPAGGLSWWCTKFIPLRRVLQVTCPSRLMRGR